MKARRALKKERRGPKDRAGSGTEQTLRPEPRGRDSEAAAGAEYIGRRHERGRRLSRAPAAEKRRKGFFSKDDDPRDEKIEEPTDRVKRQMAEFDEFPQATDKRKSAMYEMRGAKDNI